MKGALDTFIQQGSIIMVRTRTILCRAGLAASVAVAALAMATTAARADMPAAAKKLIDEFKLAPEVVAERYPFIKFNYSRGSAASRP